MGRPEYLVGVYDRAGEYCTTSCTDFAHLLSVVALMRRTYTDKVVRAFNMNRADYDSDGLTADERDAVDEVM